MGRVGWGDLDDTGTAAARASDRIYTRWAHHLGLLHLRVLEDAIHKKQVREFSRIRILQDPENLLQIPRNCGLPWNMHPIPERINRDFLIQPGVTRGD